MVVSNYDTHGAPQDLAPELRRWKCAKCGGTDIQVCFPAWFREGKQYELVHLDTDTEADARFHCVTCEDEAEVIDLAEI